MVEQEDIVLKVLEQRAADEASERFIAALAETDTPIQKVHRERDKNRDPVDDGQDSPPCDKDTEEQKSQNVGVGVVASLENSPPTTTAAFKDSLCVCTSIERRLQTVTPSAQGALRLPIGRFTA